MQPFLRNAVTGLDHGSGEGIRGKWNAGGLMDQAAQIYGINTFIIALVDHLENVVRLYQCHRHLQSSRSPTPRNRQISTGKRHEMSGQCHCFEQFAPHLTLGILIDEREVIQRFRLLWILVAGSGVLWHEFIQ